MLTCLRRFLVAALLVAAAQFSSVIASAADSTDYISHPPPLIDRLTPDVVQAIFPGAEKLEVASETPPAVAAYKAGAIAGYIFSTLDVVHAHGYSVIPFDIVAGVDLTGKITGSMALYHQEPMIMEDAHRTELMKQFLHDTAGMSTSIGAKDGPPPEFIFGTSTSARAFRSAIRESARVVLRTVLGTPVVTEPTLDLEGYHEATKEELLADGSIGSITITNSDVEKALTAAEAIGGKLEVAPKGGPEDTYIQLRAGLATPAAIGRNALPVAAHDKLFSAFAKGSHGIFLGSSGVYDFLGHKYLNKSSGYMLDRVRILQGDHVFTFDKSHYIRGGGGQTGLGVTNGIVVIEPNLGFDPLQPWSAEVSVDVTAQDGAVTTVALPLLTYALPQQYILMPEPEPLPAWMEAWVAESTSVYILTGALAVLTLILATQRLWTRHRRVHRWLRNGFLVFTLVWLGWMNGGQLSIIHLVNYLRAPIDAMDVGFYLAEPLIVMISIYVAVSLLLLGRGVFCGWLCPFGALQELLAQVSRFFKLPQWNPSFALQRKLWWGKYASLAAIVGVAFLLPTATTTAAEVEPFKTAISDVFMRGAPYVAWALVLLGAGLFTERAFCRFLCPLGGALAILDHLHLLTLLKRKPECGSPCHLCERSCPVKAIQPDGKIKMAECFQCLDCMVEYNDPYRCPPLAVERKKRERAAAAPRPALVINRVGSAS